MSESDKLGNDELEQERLAAEDIRRKRSKKPAIIAVSAAVVIVAAALAVTQVIIPAVRYNSAEKLFAAEDYDGAIAAFTELGDYKDSAERVEEVALTAKYAEAVSFEENGELEKAAIAFAKLGGFSDAKAKSAALWEKIACRNTLAAGSRHTVGLKSDGTVVAAGSDYFGQCDVSEWTDIAAIAAGYEHTVGLKSDGTVIAVGRNDFGQCDVSEWTDIAAISASWINTVGLKPDGTVVAAGSNRNGQCDVSGWTDIKIPNR